MNIATKHEPARLSLAPIALPSAWADRTALLIGVAPLVRLIAASSTGLSDTEAYYAQWARVPALSYYDHPPLVAWTTWIVQQVSRVPGPCASARSSTLRPSAGCSTGSRRGSSRRARAFWPSPS